MQRFLGILTIGLIVRFRRMVWPFIGTVTTLNDIVMACVQSPVLRISKPLLRRSAKVSTFFSASKLITAFSRKRPASDVPSVTPSSDWPSDLALKVVVPSLTPPGVSLASMIQNLENELPWIH